ncbi:NADH-quinone oxidoreductase subunit N [Balneolales bacterium ANBcel1]|nr:NADH-quinone oxidoreductase subunit N [Balneolales bacterium ANBcel1]
MESANELLTILPLIIIGAAGLLVMMLDAFTENPRLSYGTTVLLSILALGVAIYDLFGPTGTSFYELITYGGTAAFGAVLVMTGTLFSVLLTRDYLENIGHHIAEVYSMILFAAFGMLLLVQSNNLVTLFLGIETMSISLYVLAGLVKGEKKSIEAALKYFLLGAFATGFLLYGIALLYGASGSTFLVDIAAVENKGLIYWAGVALLLVGFFFKISAVPFHMWTPDVYHGAPTTITAFMATASKSAAIVAFVLVLSRALPEARTEWADVIWVFAILTMVVGNVLALVQDNVKRMLAYSSIAHAGYIMIGLAAGTPAAYSAVLFYLFAYTLMNVGAFGIVAYMEWHKGQDFTEIKSYSGLGFQQPVMGVMMSIFLFSMVGIPPFAGFIGKYRVFAAAIDEGLISLVIVGVLASAASVYYYLRVMVYLYMKENETGTVLTRPGVVYTGALLLLAAMTIYFGINPGGLVDLLGSFKGASY